MLATVPLRSVFVTTSGPAAVVIVLLYVFNSSRGAFLFSEKMTLVRGEPTSGALWTLKVSLFSPDLERFFLWPLDLFHTCIRKNRRRLWNHCCQGVRGPTDRPGLITGTNLLAAYADPATGCPSEFRSATPPSALTFSKSLPISFEYDSNFDSKQFE